MLPLISNDSRIPLEHKPHPNYSLKHGLKLCENNQANPSAQSLLPNLLSQSYLGNKEIVS